jgi:glycosyltransferase involved in cell wall biosynthesis
MTHIGHLFDGSAGWEQRLGIHLWLKHAPPGRYTNSLVAIEPAAMHSLCYLSAPIEVLPSLWGLAALSAPAVVRFASRHRIDLIHAWGVHAAAAARASTSTPLIVQLFDPLTAARNVKLLRVLARKRNFAVACSCGIVRRRLIEGGLPSEVAVVIRPGVDFGVINECRRGSLREQLNMAVHEYVVVLPEPVTRIGGQFEGFWAAALHALLSGDVCIIVPGESREQQRIARFARNLPVHVRMIMPGPQYPFERLLAVSDVLLVTPCGDISTTAIAWAMGAGVAVIATAVHSVAELIANNVNGLLFKATPGKGMGGAIVRLLRDRAAQERVRETARGQAYLAFSMRRYIEQYMRLYQNVLDGAPPAAGIVDSAMAV